MSTVTRYVYRAEISRAILFDYCISKTKFVEVLHMMNPGNTLSERYLATIHTAN